MTNRLQWEVFVSAQIPVVTNDLPPGASEMTWSPIASTLISGKRDAVLVDTAITVDQNQRLFDWIAHSGKNLTTIYCASRKLHPAISTQCNIVTSWVSAASAASS